MKMMIISIMLLACEPACLPASLPSRSLALALALALVLLLLLLLLLVDKTRACTRVALISWPPSVAGRSSLMSHPGEPEPPPLDEASTRARLSSRNCAQESTYGGHTHTRGGDTNTDNVARPHQYRTSRNHMGEGAVGLASL